jgi:hypothetical protein
MLRYALFQPDVDRVIVAMRRKEWVVRNRDSFDRGALTAEERRWLERLRGPAVRRKTWWQRVSRRG